MTYFYHIATSSSFATSLIAEKAIVSVDYSPCIRYYGEVELTRVLSEQEQEEWCLYPVTDDSIANAAEETALYNAECRHHP